MRKIIILFLVFFSFSIIGCANETKEEETKEEETKYKGWINKNTNFWITLFEHHAIKISSTPITNRICIFVDDDKINLNHINNWYFVEYRYKPFEYSSVDYDDEYYFKYEYRNYIEDIEREYEYKIKQYNFIIQGDNPSDIIYTVN